MKPRTLLLLLLICALCLVYLALRPKYSGSIGRGGSTSTRRDGHRRRPGQTPERGRSSDQAEASCNALGVTCASTYFNPWAWPANGTCTLGTRNGYPVPDPRCTPGGVVPHLDADVLRDARWRTRCIRDCQSTEKQKHVAYSWYGLTGPAQNNGANQTCELDHLVPLELGGADGLGNIWPQCGPDNRTLKNRYFKRKDEVENYLAAQVESGQMPLEEAQRGIASDWTQYLDASRRGSYRKAAPTAQ